jgi:plasmid stabilization system protein ParE
MVFKIEFSDEARLDLHEARGYYSTISDELLIKLDTSMIEGIERLEKNPENFQKRYRDLKIIFTKVFHYGIHYLVIDETVYIQRILHQKQFYK